MIIQNTPPADHARPALPYRMAGKLLLLAGALLILLWLGRLMAAGLSLRDHLGEVQSLADDPRREDLGRLCASTQGMRADLLIIRQEGGFVLGAAPLLGRLPGVGGDLEAAPHLLATADALTEATVLLCNVAGGALAGMASSAAPAPSLADALALLRQNRTALDEARVAAERASVAWSAVDHSRLSPRLQGYASKLDRGLPLLVGATGGAAAAPGLLGFDGPRRYLLLALNEDELRPGGGFISSAGEVTVEDGRVTGLAFRDSYGADDFTQPYPLAPEPLQRYMGIDLWVFRDSNWSPDYPTAAKQALDLYRPGPTASFDGVIALNQRALQGVVEALGGVDLPGNPERISGQNVISYIRSAYEPEEGQTTGEWWQERKSFMGPLADAIYRKIESGAVNWSAVAQSVVAMLERKDVQVYVADPALEQILSAQGWDGALPDGPGDFLMVVDANVGYNKTSALVQREFVYEVQLLAPRPQAVLTLNYRNTSAAQIACVPEERYDPTYAQMMDRCYWNYLRVYVPAGAELTDATSIPLPGTALRQGIGEFGKVEIAQAPEGPWLSLETLMLLHPGESQARSYSLLLPEEVIVRKGRTGSYELRIPRQAGSSPAPLTVGLRLPLGASLTQSTPAPSRREGATLVYETLLDRDLRVAIEWSE